MTDSGGRHPRKLTHGSLFSGIGGFDLGFRWASIRTVWQVERSEFCKQILERHFPNAQRHKDVREVGAKNLSRVDIISGGSPCQDLSGASPRRQGLEGERSRLWREMHRICAELVPSWCIFENVPELRARGADTIASAMEDLGYTCTPLVVGAHALGAPHERNRVWLVCHLDAGDGLGARRTGSLSLAEERELYDAQQEWRRIRNELGRTVGDDGRASYSKIRRKFHGVSRRMDRLALQALANAVVPQIPMLIGSFIRQYEQGGPTLNDLAAAGAADPPLERPGGFDPPLLLPPRKQTVVINSEFISWARTYSGPKFHACLCDPSYGYHFMGAKWDDPKQMTKSQVHSYLPSGQRITTLQENIEFQSAARQWGEAMLPHLYPGALVMMFGGPRMFAWLATGMQLAGFEMWDTMTFFWVHAQGFPKAQDLGKQVAKLTGEQPIGEVSNRAFPNAWRGYKTPALKPAHEPILCFRAPRNGMTYAELATTYGTGCLNVDGGRIPTNEDLSVVRPGNKHLDANGHSWGFRAVSRGNEGRYPANVGFDEGSAALLDEQSGHSVSGKQRQPRGTGGIWSGVSNTPCGPQHDDRGGASRFFFCAKASSQERNAGCEDLPNDHLTVKPLALTRHLATLLLPPASVAPRRLFVPFLGSGSEMIGALQAGWDEILGVEQNAHYCEIANRRIEYWRTLPPASDAA